MNEMAKSFVCGPAARTLFAAAACFSFPPATAFAQLESSGFPVENPDWEILVTDFGYADLALDRRPGYLGREYLSGEWSTAIFYSGGQNPAGPVWFQPQWYFPDWVSNSNFTVEKTIGLATPANPNNADGFPVYQSIITNSDLRITINYEMLNSGTGIAQGLSPKGAGGTGSSLASSRYVFRQTFRITNISGAALTNIRLFQFLHGLEVTKGFYDDRSYPGAMADYRYDITQQGDSLGFNMDLGTVVTHHDTIALHAKVMPAAWETGYFGRKGVDDHGEGKPPVGVHLKVETNSLNGLDSFDPPEGGWVSGAQRFDLGNLAAGASATHDVLFTVQSTEDIESAPVRIVIHNVQRTGGNFIIDFEETSGGPVAFFLRKSTDVTKPWVQWEFLPLPYTIDSPRPGWNRFEVPVVPGEPKAFFRIQPLAGP